MDDENEVKSEEQSTAQNAPAQQSEPTQSAGIETAFFTQVVDKINELYDLQRNTNARLEAYFTNSSQKENEGAETVDEKNDDDSLKY